MTRESLPELDGPADDLLRAVLAIYGDLELDRVLDRLAAAAAALTRARYGALGVIGADGRLTRFLTTGIDRRTEELIGARPEGRGLLGVLISDPRPLRLDDLSADPRAVGMPAHHPPMRSFLGVPITIRGTVFGNLYLADKDGGDPFTEDDERMVVVLASAAALVIDNARAYTLSERLRQWNAAAADLVTALQPPVSLARATQEIVDRTRAVTDARTVAVVTLPPPAAPVIAAVSNAEAVDDVADLILRVVAEMSSLDLTETSVQDVVVDDVRAVVVPMLAGTGDPAVLVLLCSTEAGPAFEERQMLISFVDQATSACERARAFAERQELAVVRERARIARDLHDVVIQRLFAAGMKLHSLRVSGAVPDPVEVDRIVDDVVGDLDLTIEDIRTTIFGLQQNMMTSVHADLIRLIDDYREVLGFRPLLRTHGPLDLMVTDGLATNLVAVTREALSNVARHAGAHSVTVDLRVTMSAVELEVSDDGTGIGSDRSESGLRNARERAELLGGALRVDPGEGGGTVLHWTCPLPR